jgi:hypothetical protein
MVDYTRTAPHSQTTRQVTIQSVDVATQSAATATAWGNVIYVDTSYYVGATQVTPAVGEQWQIQKLNGDWRLMHRLPFNDPNQGVAPTQGQHVVGSGQGPVELQGTTINIGGPLSIQNYTTANLPDATSLPVGSHVYDSTLGKPVWTNGSVWTDSSGTPI